MLFLNNIHDFLFLSFGLIALSSASMVVLSRNSVRSVLSLIITFVSTAGIWLLLEAEFLAIILVLVYVGAVMVLFLFVVMMLELNFTKLKIILNKWVVLGLGLGLSVFILMCQVLQLNLNMLSNSTMIAQNTVTPSNAVGLGTVIFTRYLLEFELAGIILLVAIIAAIGLIYRGPRNRKVQNISDQIKVKASERLRLVSGN